ncbi:S8 family peptidase [Maricaulis sp.]|uniref:S8 family peptidase n=1 Tax=Maricaulis sp. TaxID=1486257 RepID=UPI0026222F99|nr:S8 family peptidase [Maricaulis sp.]
MTGPAAFETAEYQAQYGLGLMNTSHAYAEGAFGAGVTVAVIDSGIDASLPEFAGRLAPNSVSIWEQQGGTVGDYNNGHGSLVASVIAANRNDVGTHGVAPEVTVLAIRVDRGVEDASNPGSSFPLYTETDLALSIDYAVDQGADVINISLGRPPEFYESNGNAIRAALERAASAGIVVSIAAGNFNPSTPLENRITTSVPQIFADNAEMNGHLVIVPAIDQNSQIAGFSARAGDLANFAISAPGADIYIALSEALTGNANGTSAAAPHIAGALALILGHFPNMTPIEALQLLYDTARDLGDPGVDDIYGHGAPDLEAAFAPQGNAQMALSDGKSTLGIAGLIDDTDGAFGDWTRHTALFEDAVFLDDYDRAFSVNAYLRTQTYLPTMLPALEQAARRTTDQVRHIALTPFTSASLLEPQPELQPFSQLDAEMTRQQPGFAFDTRQGDWRVRAGRGFGAPGTIDGTQQAVLGGTAHVGATAQLGLQRSWGAASWSPGAWEIGLRTSGNGAAGFQAVSLARRIDDHQIAMETGNVVEARSAMGSQTLAAGSHHSRTAFAAVAWSGPVQGNWQGSARVELAYPELAMPGSMEVIEPPLASAWSLALSRPLGNGALGLHISQPLRAERGMIRADMPVAVNDNGELVFEQRTGALTPSGREISAEVNLNWTVPGGAGATLATRYTREAGHSTYARDDISLWFGLRARH